MDVTAVAAAVAGSSLGQQHHYHRVVAVRLMMINADRRNDLQRRRGTHDLHKID